MPNKHYHKTAYKKLREKVLIRDNYTCQYCGQEANTLDHIIPISKGGIDCEDNAVAACSRCNSSKRDRMTPGAFLPHTPKPSTPLGIFIPGKGETKRHYA